MDAFCPEDPCFEETEINLREAHIKFLKRNSFRFLIFHKVTKEFIGQASLQGIDWNLPKGELGYWINTESSGNGFMTEAIRELTRFGLELLHFKRIEIRVESTNVKSRSIAEKSGYKLEGILKNDDISADGKQLTDTCVYAMTNQ